MSAHMKWGALVSLVVVWVFLIAIRLLTNSEPQQAPLVYQTGNTSDPKGAAVIGNVLTVKGSQQNSAGRDFREPKNIFASLYLPHQGDRPAAPLFVKREVPTPIVPPPSPSLPPPPLPVTVPPAPTAEELAAQEARRQKEYAAQQTRQQLAQYRFLGYLTQHGEQRAFLGKEKNIYIVRHGETLDGRIMVKTIDGGFIQLMDATTRVEQKIPLTTESGSALVAQ